MSTTYDSQLADADARAALRETADLRAELAAAREQIAELNAKWIAEADHADAAHETIRGMREALEAARSQILDSYRTWVADDVTALPKKGQIPRYDQVIAALTLAAKEQPDGQ